MTEWGKKFYLGGCVCVWGGGCGGVVTENNLTRILYYVLGCPVSSQEKVDGRIICSSVSNNLWIFFLHEIILTGSNFALISCNKFRALPNNIP